MDASFEVVRRVMQELAETRRQLTALQQAAADLLDTLRAIANDQDSNDFSDGDKWRGLKAAAQDAVDAYEQAAKGEG